jgi:hypothetical protein
MGARQVLGVAAGLVAIALAWPRAAHADEPVILVDLRPGADEALRASRAALRAELASLGGLVLRDEPGLDEALAGDAQGGDDAAQRAALEEARAAFGDLDCGRALAAADRAVLLGAARQAAGHADRLALRGAWAYVLLCSDRAGDRGRAQAAADQLRALGLDSGDAAGIPAAVWDRFPEIDASTDRDIVPLTVAEPAGAAVWIDHARVGTAPVTVHVAAGEHVVAVADGTRRGDGRIRAEARPLTVTVDLAEGAGAFAAAAAVVAGWRSGRTQPTAEALGTLMRRLEVRFALLLAGRDTVQVWVLGPGDARPRKLDDASRRDPMAIGAIVVDRAAAWDGRAPDPDRPLLRESPDDRGRRRGTPDRWWVYAAIVGAVAAGTAILYFQDAAEDHQRIEIRFP